MKHMLRKWRSLPGLIATALLCLTTIVPQATLAGTVGNVAGTVTDSQSGAPLANVKVTAASPSQTATTTTDARGFYTLVNLSPDSYSISFQKAGYEPESLPGIAVFQDETQTVNEKMSVSLKTIATVHAAGGSNLVKSNQGSDVYNVSGQQLSAATNPGDLHETIYQYLAVTPGITGGGFPAQPRVRGGQVTDLGYEFEGIPIQDRITGFFTTNLANIGIGNIEVYTGGLPASGSTNGTGYFNSVLKTGTYPGYTDVFVQATSPEFNHYITIERGGGTPDHRFTYYVGFDGVGSQNQYDYGEHTFPDVLMWGYNGPGPVKTRDLVSNFIYRPSQNDALQFVYTNSLGEFDYNYLLNKSSGEPPALSFQSCQGNTASGTSYTGFAGGVAPNGQACPTGMYWGALPNGTGNFWHHYGGLGKLQWNHNINDHSSFNLRVAENFNQYIFDQPMADPNIPQWENAGGAYNWPANYGQPASDCPTYPYAAGTPVQQFTYVDSKGKSHTHLCSFYDGIEVFWGDRRSNMYFGNFDYTNVLNSNLTVKAGVDHEIDDNVYNYFLTNSFNSNGTWPNNYLHSVYPTTINTGYAEADIRAHKFLLVPGLAYAQEHYGYPGGGKTVSIVNPTFNGTYTFSPDDVVRFSYGNTSSFVGAGYVYRTGSSVYNPNKPGFNFSPQLNHSADLMWEHNFGNNTSLRFGPWFNKTSNYFEQYTPFMGYVGGVPTYGKPVLSNAQAHNAFGFELGLNHINTQPRGTSFWLAGTYTNYWTTSTSLAGSFVNTPLPQNLIDQGVFVRASGNPMFSGTLLADYHSDRFHFDPLLYYQVATFYNIGVISTNGGTVAPYISQPEMIAGAYWRAKVTTYEELGPKRNVIAGFTVDNLFDNTNDVTPCKSYGSGCFPFDGPQSGIMNQTGYIYQNYTQSPRTFYFFAGIKM
jgi:hypothetical protein